MSLIHQAKQHQQQPQSPVQAPPSQQQQRQNNLRLTNNNKREIKLLIASPSPRRIKQFKEKLDYINTKYDVFQVKFDFIEINAYNSIRRFFLDHKEYTHLAILPDDLLVDMKHVDKLVKDLEQYDYAVISGICNFACTNTRMYNKMGAIEYGKMEAFNRMRTTGRFDYFADIMSRERFEEIVEKLKNKPNRIIRVTHSAFPLTIIRRDVVEKIEFGSNLMGVDTDFFQKLIKEGIAAYADLDVQTFHLKGIEENREIDELLNTAYFENIDTRVKYTQSNPPQREEIFSPAIQNIKK